MPELNIVAVGSSPLIAAEIQGLLREILGHFFTIDTVTTDSVQEAAPHTFYICANTQGKKLQSIIPPEQLFIWELHPTTRFFLDIAQIPAHSDVYVFNNLLPYTELLAKECQTLGIDTLNFHPLPIWKCITMRFMRNLAKHIISLAWNVCWEKKPCKQKNSTLLCSLT